MRPAMEEADLARYKAAYCGLCRVMGRRYGLVSQMFLNYDFAFLAMVLSRKPDAPCFTCARCMAHPWRKRQHWQADAGLELAAAESVILAYWKLRDSVQDEALPKRLLARLLSLLLRRGYRKAARDCPAFDETVQRCLTELRQMETACLPSLDRPADAFARILQAASGVDGQVGQAALSQMLYHIGRWIYLIDAWDDLEDDRKHGAYNPILMRGDDTEKGKQALQETLSASLAAASDAAHWQEFGVWTPLVENIVSLGLPAMQDAVLRGLRQSDKKRNIRRSNNERSVSGLGRETLSQR